MNLGFDQVEGGFNEVSFFLKGCNHGKVSSNQLESVSTLIFEIIYDV